MRYSTIPLAGMAATAFAADANLVWQHHTLTGVSSLSIFDGTKDNLLAHTCGSVLETAAVDFSLVEDDGTGNFTVGDAEYHIHYLPSHSGGPSCSTVYNERTTVVECEGVPFDGGHSAPPAASKRALDECFKHEDVQSEFRRLRSRSTADYNSSPPAKARQRRQAAGAIVWHTRRDTVLDGDGSPYEAFYHQQKTSPLDCGGGSCTASYQEGDSFTVGFTATVTPYEWFSGGFSVSKSYTESRGYNCNGEDGQTVCVWHNTAHTAYWSMNRARDGAAGEASLSDPFVIRSPNNNNRGGNYYCVRGPCRAVGDSYWDEP